MLGIIVQLGISWLLVWLVQKKDLGVLGFRPCGTRFKDFSIFFLVTAVCCASGFVLRSYYGEQWVLNPDFNVQLLGAGLKWHIQSVLFEELIFRGVLLYILIRRLGSKIALVISAIAFGIYHWFSHEVIGDPGKMLTTFFITGLMGWLLAYGYARSASLYIPIAIHLGWNFTQGFIFPQGPIGMGILISAATQSTPTVSYFIYYMIVFFPLASALLINFILLRRLEPVKFIQEINTR